MKKRAYFYQLQCLMKDERNQKHGIVSILYMVNTPTSTFHSTQQKKEFWEMNRLGLAMPLRTCCAHVCYNDDQLKVALAVTILQMTNEESSRICHHRGKWNGRIL